MSDIQCPKCNQVVLTWPELAGYGQDEMPPSNELVAMCPECGPITRQS